MFTWIALEQQIGAHENHLLAIVVLNMFDKDAQHSCLCGKCAVLIFVFINKINKNRRHDILGIIQT